MNVIADFLPNADAPPDGIAPIEPTQEVEIEPLTPAELAQYNRRTTKRPGLWLLFIASSPLIVEGLCRLLGAS